ncbi:BrnA antitoxin family protein [uncultured Sulfitobacter sp.]|uniref:BrnA antitoxin family protein n=1 Tax=uncultured Sulfitobacter sp. TaxID=191468 RepID=UPI00262B2393|nr:BrnA antitoxin family protein [uncultured Sulfitobacter sp.]
MTALKREPLIDADGEVREITAEDLKHARRGRPPLPQDARKKRVNLMLDPAVVEALKERGVMSAEANRLLRKALGL